MYQFLIVDDHQLFAEGLQFVIEGLIPNASCDLAFSSTTALDHLSVKNYDLVLVDLNMPGVDGLALIRANVSKESNIQMVILSSEQDKHRIHQAMKAGARGFIPKSAGSGKVVSAIHTILAGDIYYDAEQLNQASWINAQDEHEQRLLLYGITSRQFEVLNLMRSGQSNKEIARLLSVSPNTVKFHIKALLKTLQAKNRTECIERAKTLRLLDEAEK